MGIKVWLDDVRPAPDGWNTVRWPQDAIELLARGNVSRISLDHDLGDDARGTGYDVLLWIEQATMVCRASITLSGRRQLGCPVFDSA